MPGQTDPEIAGLRERLTAVDEGIVASVNERVRLVAELQRVKAERGIDFLDPAREEWLHDHLAATSSGPLSAAGVRQLVTELLALTKRELG